MKLILNIIVLFLTQITFAQQAELIDKTNSKLIDNDLLSISVDNEGNKWIGSTKFGLIKYDNTTFEIFNKENSEIKGDYISPIFSDSKGNIWISFSKPKDGIAKFNGKEWVVYNAKDLQVSEVSVITIKEDDEGSIYFSGSEGILKFDGKEWSKIDLPDGNYLIRTMDINSKGDIAIGHNSGLLIREDDKWNTYTEDNSELRLGTVRAVKFFNKNELIVGYGGGFGDGGFSIIKADKWTHFNKSNSKVPDHMVRDIEIDGSGIVWMATNNGLIKMEKEIITPILFREGMFKNVIMDISIENDVLWIATNFGLIKMK